MRLTDDEYNALISRRAVAAGKSPKVETVKAASQPRREASTEQTEGWKAKLLPPTKIIRQSSKGLNKTEQRFLNEYLNPLLSLWEIDEIAEHESITLRLANGLRFRPDFPTWKGEKLTFYEVKGGFIREDAIKSLKMAANKYTRFRFVLCQYVKGEWAMQEVLA